jgi:hypothetical protein
LSEKKLTAGEKKLLAAVVKCGQNYLTAGSLAKEAGVSIKFVCEQLKDPEFRAMFTELVCSSLVAETPAILHTFAKLGKEGSFQHGKLILEIAGVHQDKQRVELDAKVDISESPFGSDEERREFLEGTLGKLGSSKPDNAKARRCATTEYKAVANRKNNSPKAEDFTTEES